MPPIAAVAIRALDLFVVALILTALT